MWPYLAIKGTARITDGSAPELLKKLATTMLGVGGLGPWAA